MTANRLLPTTFALLLAVAASAPTARAQDMSIGYRVYINPNEHTLQKWETVRCDPASVPSCSVTGWRKIAGDTLDALAGSANISVNPSNGAVLHVNYWHSEAAAALNKHNPVIELENREPVTFRFRSHNVALASVPFRVRSGQSKDRVKVPATATAVTNAGLLYTFQQGQLRYFPEANATRAPFVRWQVGPALYAGASVVELSEESSRLNPVAADRERSLLVASVGVGIAFGSRDFNVLGMIGWDWGLNEGASHWDYNGGMWYGIGIGLKPLLRNL